MAEPSVETPRVEDAPSPVSPNNAARSWTFTSRVIQSDEESQPSQPNPSLVTTPTSPDGNVLSTCSIAAEEINGVKVDEKIETFENLTPADQRNEEFRANQKRKKGFLISFLSGRARIGRATLFW